MATKREKKKKKQVETMRKSIEKLRKQVDKDMKSDDEKTRLSALATKLMDLTYARVGNQASEDESGHYGVTGWKKDQISFNGKGMTISYTGKSGVDQKKTIEDKKVIDMVKELYGRGPDELVFSYPYDEEEDNWARLRGKDINEYLEDYDVTAKDIRGFHANREMKEVLEKIRKDGPKLPDDKDEREELLKEEFEEALETVAKCLGHEPSTLKNQYLVEGFEDHFKKEGEPLEKFSSLTRLSCRVAFRYLDRF